MTGSSPASLGTLLLIDCARGVVPHNAPTVVNGHLTLHTSLRQLAALALAISLGAAVSLGITRFAYGLLLPAMRSDLGWSYALAGAMNTANATGYFLGALACPWLMRRLGPSMLLVGGALLASVFMVGSGFVTQTEGLLLQRLLAGVASALVFVAGGLLAARLGARDPQRSGLLIGLYYGGTGVGITLSALLVPAVLQVAQASAHGWRWAWWALGALCLLFSLVLWLPARSMAAWPSASPVPGQLERHFRWRQFGFGLAGYTLFGVGYIGYMTFVVALLRGQGRSVTEITVFYALLGVAVMASSRLWAGLLDRHQDGKPLALLNALLGLATLLPALTKAWPLVLLSGLLFGAVFLRKSACLNHWITLRPALPLNCQPGRGIRSCPGRPWRCRRPPTETHTPALHGWPPAGPSARLPRC